MANGNPLALRYLIGNTFKYSESYAPAGYSRM